MYFSQELLSLTLSALLDAVVNGAIQILILPLLGAMSLHVTAFHVIVDDVGDHVMPEHSVLRSRDNLCCLTKHILKQYPDTSVIDVPSLSSPLLSPQLKFK